MWLMLQQEKPEDFVVATGHTYSVREFVEKAFGFAGFSIKWEGTGLDEVGRDADSGKVMVRIDKRYYRPTEVDFLLGDPSKAEKMLGWKAKTGFEELVEEMLSADLHEAERELLCKNSGFQTFNHFE